MYGLLSDPHSDGGDAVASMAQALYIVKLEDCPSQA
jgi:hypothetical protein